MTTQQKYTFDTRISSAVPADSKRAPRQRRPMPSASSASKPLSATQLLRMQHYWQAANYLTIGQIYLQENPLLREPLRPEHIKPRLLGHWGTSPGLNFIYVHLNRLITERDANIIYLAGPGHGGPALVANVYLEGVYSEIYPHIRQNIDGLRSLFRQFSTPGGIPSHVSVQTPGSIHEGGELGYVLAHAYGAVFDNPDLIAAAVVGDGEAETGPLAGSWKGTSFLNPARDGAVLPILHLNGYKISGPTVSGRASDKEIRALLEGNGYEAHFVEGDDPERLHQQFAATLDDCYARIRQIQTRARAGAQMSSDDHHGEHGRLAHWPAIVLRTPKGWTGPKVVDGKPVEGTFRAHQVPLAEVKSDPEHLAQLEAWMRSYEPERLFDEHGRLHAELAELAPKDNRRMGANPHANGGRLTRDLTLRPLQPYARPVSKPGNEAYENTRPFGAWLRDIFVDNTSEADFRLFCPDETNSNRLDDVFEVENRCYVGPTLAIDDHLSPDGRVMEVLSEHLCEGWLEGYTLTGRHGIFVTYEAFAMVSASMTVQHTKWLEESLRLPWRAPVPSLNVLLTSTCWRNDHNGFSHQGPGLIDVILSKRGSVARIYLPPDANCLLSVGDHCLRSRSYVNLIVIDKQQHLQYLTMEEAAEHCALGASTWRWAGTEVASADAEAGDADVVLACAGDVPTLETLAAAEWLRRHVPRLKTRVVNIVDLMTLFPPDQHPHGMSEQRFVELFTKAKPVIFAFHGYQRAVHQFLHGRTNPERFHVRGFTEQGTTTTPFDMVVLNGMSRYHLAMEAIRRTSVAGAQAHALRAELEKLIAHAVQYSRDHLEDLPSISNWRWNASDANRR
ncbi:MAG TPA: phosphoketolase family protein [Ktedonobacterales bacterium]|nr:phosphoketolase family protein [Ktedonobacterales bacterium]